MKHTRAYIYILVALCVGMLGTACGDDMPGPETGNGSQPVNNVKAPSINEASVSFSTSLKVITFKASCPDGTRMTVLIQQLTNGTMKKELDVSYNTTSQQYYARVPDLVGGSTYSYCIVGYDSEGKEATRTTVQTFSLPKDAAPDAPSTDGIKAYAPTSANATNGYIKGNSITKDMEYSTDNGATWKPVTVAGIISNLQPGNVLLRLAETATTEAGKAATIVVPPYQSNIDPDGSGGNSEGLRLRQPMPREN